MDGVKLDDGSKGIGNAAPWINLDHVNGFEPSVDEENARYVQINKEIARVDEVLNINGTVGPSDSLSIMLPDHFNSIDNYYKDVDVVVIDRAVTGEAGQDLVLQRRKIAKYTGYTRLALFTEAFNPVPQAGSTQFVMRAIRTKRGEQDTGSISVAGSGLNILVTYLGQVHPQLSCVYFLNSSWTALAESAQWSKSTGVITGLFFADTLPSQTLKLAVPLINPPDPQIPQNITIAVNGVAGIQTSVERLNWDLPAGAYWPIVFPLLICHAGTWMSSGDVTCTDCVIGKYSEACGGFGCDPCVPTTYTSLPRQTSCLDCEIGYKCLGNSDRTACPPGQYSEAKSSVCLNCTRGTYCPGAQYFVQCVPGDFMNETGATACYNCEAGKYAGFFGAWNCTDCPSGTISPPRARLCTGCAAGTYNTGTGNSVCESCGQNTYQPLTGTTTCVTCPLNTGARNVMGICTGACKGSITKLDCLCAPGFTRFGQTSDECVAFHFSVAKMGQSTACPAKANIIGVTLQSNAELTTAVGSIAIIDGGQGYADAKLEVLEPGGTGFEGRAFADPTTGQITSVLIDEGGSQFTGFPASVKIYYSKGCADDDSLCPYTLQDGTITTIRVLNKGTGYISGRVRISGGGGSGAAAYFATDSDGKISAVRFQNMAMHGKGYNSPVSLELTFTSATRCDQLGNSGVVNLACGQAGTITSVSTGQGLTSGCDNTVRLFTSGGGGSGFYATVTNISPLGGIRQFEIVNHGTGYTSDPNWLINNAGCTCNGIAGTSVGSFNPCVSFRRARGAVVSAHPAMNASLQATTGTRVILTGLESGSMMHPVDAVPIYAIGAASISSAETQACGILSNGSAVCWGKSEQHFTANDIQTWTCGYMARYWRFTPLATRDGGRMVQMAELEFYEKGSEQKLSVVEATNPGGRNPPGLFAALAADGDKQTKWADELMQPLQFDFGKAVGVDRYRWMTSSEDEGADPMQWRIEAANEPENGDHWIKIHEISRSWHGEYSVATAKTSRGIEYFQRNTWTRFWVGSCSIPLGQSWRAVSVQAFHGCGVNAAGIGYCWGHNSMRQLVFPDAPCDCSTTYNQYCSCTSANYFSIVYRKVKITAFPGQCNDQGRCFNTYSDGTCIEKECQYIYRAAECSQAGKALGYILQADGVMAPGFSAANPKGCYLITNTQVSNRVRFNANNQSSTCTGAMNCVCQDCPSFSYIALGENAYCGGTFDTEEKAKASELVGAKSVQECKVACGIDPTCDFFTFYPAEASVGCAPCCFKKQLECNLVDPNKVIPKTGTVKATSTWSHLSAGYLHTCGITMVGDIKCWGFDRDGQASPPKALGSRTWRFVATGKFHSCGILDDLTAHCWGANDQKLNTGQVLPVPGLGIYKWRMLSTGVWHTCGITQEGALYCWGCGGKDRIGRTIGLSPTGEDIDKGQCDIPKSISSSTTESWDTVSASEFHTCGITSSGVAKCWGCKCNPILCPAWNSTDINLGQCDVPFGHEWSQIAAGRRHTCGLTIHGKLICWGCLLDAKKPYFSKTGNIERQNASAARTFDIGQCHRPEGVETWMNSAAFAAKGKWKDNGLELSVRSNTIVGADYFFGFPIQNPAKIQKNAATAVMSKGMELPSKTFLHATPDVYGGLAVTVCKEGTYSTAEANCLPCHPGTYALDCGVGACTPCMPGQYSYIGSTSCTVCGLGRFSSSYGSTSCQACPSGTYGPVMGAVSKYDGCVDCAAGKYTASYNIFDEFIGNWQDIGDTSCVTCPQGYYCPGGVDKIKCAQETYNGEIGVNESKGCFVCPHGRRCNGLWKRYTCISGSGFDNGTVFSEITSCQRACFSMNRVQGSCVPSQGQDNGCVTGYDNAMCSRCIDGHYPEFMTFECKKCPLFSYQFLSLIIYSGVVLAIPLTSDVTGVDLRISVYLRIVIFFFQNQDLSLAVNVRWPTVMQIFVRALRIMNWDLMFTNPQCAFGNTEKMWQSLFLVEVGFPLCTIGLLVFLASTTGFAGPKFSRAWWRLCGFFIAWYSVPLVGTFLRAVECSCVPYGYELHRPSWDNCTFGGAYNTPHRKVLTSNPYMPCYGRSHTKAYIASYFSLMWIFVGMPMLFFFLPDLEPSLRNPFPKKKRPVSAMGLMKVMNVGIAKDEISGIGKSPGTGVIQFLEDRCQEMLELSDMGEREGVRLSGLLEDARNRGRKKDVVKYQKAIDDIEAQCDVCDERFRLLYRNKLMLEDVLSHTPDIDVTRAKQEATISQTEISYKLGLLNFVETIPQQKKRWKKMQQHMSIVKHVHGESFLFVSPVPVLWRFVRERLEKWSKSLDIIRIRALKTVFWAGTILAIAPGIAFTLLYCIWKFVHWMIPVTLSKYEKVHFLWAHYGVRSEFTGEIRRVKPLYCQRDEIDNRDDIRGCIALLFRAHGEQHESTLYKVRRVQAAGAIAALVVNEQDIWFAPKIVAENFATFQAIDIPVVGMRASDVHYIADGSIASFNFLRDPPRLFGLRRLKAFMTLVCMQPLVEYYSPDKQWFEAIVWFRRLILVLMRYILVRTPQIQACAILAVNFFYCSFTLWRPFKLDEFNRMEFVSSVSCLLSSIFVMSAAVLFGQATEGIPGLELNGSAGEFEDQGREWVFWSLSVAVVVLLVVGGLLLAQPLIYLCTRYLIKAIHDWLRPPPPLKPPPPPEDNSLPAEIDQVCFSFLHALEEFSRVIPRHSHCRSAIDVAYAVLKEQEDVILRRAFNKERRLRANPWTFVVGEGSAGFYYGKEIYCFRHHFGGMVIEVPCNSNGDIRVKNCASGEIVSCAADGILWKRDNFFAPALVQYLEARAEEIDKKERPIMISEAGLESYRDTMSKHTKYEGGRSKVGGENGEPSSTTLDGTQGSSDPSSTTDTDPHLSPMKALDCPSRFGRW